MDRKQIVETVDVYFKNIHKTLPKLRKDFNNQSIAEFRLEIKKLRAFLRLCSIELHEKAELRMSKKLKRFYGYIGIIQNLQLQQEKIATLIENEGVHCSTPNGYLSLLKSEESYWIVQAKSIVSTDDDFKDDYEEVIETLPYKLSKETLKKIVVQKRSELNELLAFFHKDEALHRIRKIVNDIIYNWQFIDLYATAALPTLLSKKENLNTLAQLLARFRNASIALNLLNSTLRDNEKNNPETACLEHIETHWQNEKELIKEHIYLKLLKLNIIPSTCFNEVVK